MNIERHTLNMLGVEIGRCDALKQENFDLKIPKLITQLHIHSQRKLSLCGRILLTKTFGILKSIHPLSIIEIYKVLLDKVQTELNKYIWPYKPPRVKHTVLTGSLDQSGLESIDIESKHKALQMPWIHRIINGKGWNDVVNEYLEPMGGLQFLLKCN